MRTRKILISLLAVIVLAAILLFYYFNSSFSTDETKAAKRIEALKCANDLYQKENASGTAFNSQCIGTCEEYAVDIVHVPRSLEDDKAENQCSTFRNKEVLNFIELDAHGTVIRIAD